ncbi:zinc ABC transporter ATP-binding protein ZnuC [Vibrio sp. SS-MA-C1-2]|uniref:zinc ABC transporter ATP-binding protein ZnuC n=1 Tax=Vibrio sp. SS-MA-C1-2 TaxID=2908646 RepID=UPI001F195877|nr:zinc ABC transporter ATP-binding protein ZnuC [Vibrio sp. SS-MA-C1-2]UJF18645.1 zinc ABC transporter ATP-binding protein ZnuC [Vibrio sp. SS-MA-C1-2]
MNHLIELKNVTVTYHQRDVLDKVSFTLDRKEIATVVGPNGAGKSTLIKTILGLVKPTSGKVIKDKKLKIGYVPQKLQLNESLPLRTDRFLQLAGRYNKQQRLDALKAVKAEHLMDSNLHGLSGGEMQRVLLARALLRQPDLLVLDEPVQGVDVNGQVEMYQLISDLRDIFNCGIMMVSHDLHLVMAKTDKVLCLHHHICCQGAPELISNDPSYLALFGKNNAEQLALYQHHHTHQHDLAGDEVTSSTNHCNHK